MSGAVIMAIALLVGSGVQWVRAHRCLRKQGCKLQGLPHCPNDHQITLNCNLGMFIASAGVLLGALIDLVAT